MHLAPKPEFLGSIPGPATYFVSCYTESRKLSKTIISYWGKYVHLVLVNRLGDLLLSRNSVVRFADHSDMTVAVYHGRKTTTQQLRNLNACTHTSQNSKPKAYAHYLPYNENLDRVITKTELQVRVGIEDNQLLQLCTARTVWSELDEAVRTVHSCNSWWLGPLWSDSVIKLVSVLFGKCTTLVVTKFWPMETRLPCGDQWKAEKLGAF